MFYLRRLCLFVYSGVQHNYVVLCSCFFSSSCFSGLFIFYCPFSNDYFLWYDGLSNNRIDIVLGANKRRVSGIPLIRYTQGKKRWFRNSRIYWLRHSRTYSNPMLCFCFIFLRLVYPILQYLWNIHLWLPLRYSLTFISENVCSSRVNYLSKDTQNTL